MYIDVLGFQLQGVHDYFIYTVDGINFAKYSIPSNQTLLGTSELSMLLYAEDITHEVCTYITDITETVTSSTKEIFSPGSSDLSDYYTKAEVDTALNSKVDAATTLAGYGITDAKITNGVITLGSQTITPVQAVSGKGLSTNDYTTAEKNKLAGIAAGAEVNVQSDWNQANTDADDFIKNKPDLT